LEPTKTLFSRRTALKTVIAGAVAAAPFGCKQSGSAKPEPHQAAARGPVGAAKVHGETFSRGHSKRDGFAFPKSEIKESCEVAIIGGGPSGLCALHLLQGRDALLLEKEDHLGGNCSTDTWQGVTFSTGAAFFTEGDRALVELMRSVGAPGLPIEGGDALIVKGEPFLDFLGEGAARLPFSQRARDDFRKSADKARALRDQLESGELDARPFSEFLSDYAPELRLFWDRFGASNWGASAEHTSARLGLSAYQWLTGAEKRLSYPGGLGTGAKALASQLEARLPGRLRTSVFTHHIELEPGRKGSVLVHTLKGDEPYTLRARAVIVAVPKFFAARIVPHVSAEQRAAMTAFRYAPYSVFNLCLNGVGPEPAYDNWFLDAPFADFIPADWVVHAGRGPRDRKTALTVYHPMPEGRRSELLEDERLVHMADDVVAHLDRHFPGLGKQVVEARVFRRGHALAMPTPGQLARADLASRSHGRIAFAHSDSRGDVSSFPGALRAAERAVAEIAS